MKTFRRRAFTLVELLVVIAIISILAAMLMPALESAVAQARLVHCMNNHKQAYLAFTLYADEHQGFIPLTSWRNGQRLNQLSGRTSWPFSQPGPYWQMGVLVDMAYLEDRNILIDPTFYTAGATTIGDHNNIYRDGTLQEKVWQNRFLFPKGCTGTYVVYGFVHQYAPEYRRLQPVERAGNTMTSLIQCRTGGLNNQPTGSHNDEQLISTYYDGHARTLSGIVYQRALINKGTGNVKDNYVHEPNWWMWATGEDES
jgi:prepilin-type N-terminal cleavage/methylation domain-containing protein